jgi:NADH-quinone oxidoreductase subunit M
VIYDRAHHRNLDDFGGIGLQMPWYTGLATVGFFASLGLPGLCGFISEALCFLGGWDTNDSLITTANKWVSSLGAKWIIYTSLLGVVLAAAYILWTIQRVYLGNLQEKYKKFQDLSFREVVALAPLAILCIVVGVVPNWAILNPIQPSLDSMREMVRSFLQLASN